MTQPSPRKLEQEKDRVFLNDAEMVRRLGVPRKAFLSLLPALESKFGFPRKDPFFSGKRYWPAVEEWLNKRHGVIPVSGGKQP